MNKERYILYGFKYEFIKNIIDNLNNENNLKIDYDSYKINTSTYQFYDTNMTFSIKIFDTIINALSFCIEIKIIFPAEYYSITSLEMNIYIDTKRYITPNKISEYKIKTINQISKIIDYIYKDAKYELEK